jgi:dUTP pyrophosphatase
MVAIKLKILDKEYYCDVDEDSNGARYWQEDFGLLPKYSTPESAGMDLRTMRDFVLPANEQMLIPTGIAIHIDNPDVCAHILPRSGLGHKEGIILGNTLGLIDSDYTSELMLSIWNRSHTTRYFSRGDRIAQLVFLPIIRATLEIVEEFANTSRTGGFGSTGV